jgi:hypothetical protein
MGRVGWETHFISTTHCVSLQEDTIRSLSAKLLRNSNWRSTKDFSLPMLFADQTKWFLIRMGRNVVKGRLLFVPIDVALWVGALKLAVTRSLAARDQRGPSAEVGAPSGSK